MYKTNVLNFIINTTGVVYEGKTEEDKNKFIRENLPDSMDTFINIMNGTIPHFRKHYKDGEK